MWSCPFINDKILMEWLSYVHSMLISATFNHKCKCWSKTYTNATYGYQFAISLIMSNTRINWTWHAVNGNGKVNIDLKHKYYMLKTHYLQFCILHWSWCWYKSTVPKVIIPQKPQCTQCRIIFPCISLNKCEAENFSTKSFGS
jgi:hypothetical protein